MNRLFKKAAGVAAALAVMISAIPMGVFAANCAVHTPNADQNGIVINYVTEAEHYNICTECCTVYDRTAHTDTDADSFCDGCGATLDSGTTKHTHDKLSAFSYRDKFGHMYECGTGCTGVFETHTNCVAGDRNGDGTWDCDYCMWDGPIVGMGGGGSSHQHTQKTENGEPVFEIGPAGHRPICADCGQPYDGGVHYDDDNDGACDECGETILCDHENAYRWWDTDETEHTLHCSCGYPVAPAVAHFDDDNDGLCDECGVGVDSQLKHTHVWSPDWSHNNDNTEHFNDCTDIACTRSANLHTAADADGDGICDACNHTMGNGGGQGHTHTFNDDKYVIDPQEHAPMCDDADNCGYNGAFEPHSDDDSNGRCDGCNAIVVFDAGENLYVHNHTSTGAVVQTDVDMHLTECSTCDRIYWEDHTDDDGDELCDICNEYMPPECDHSDTGYTVEEEEHRFWCERCGKNLGEWERHNDGDENGKCDDCGVGTDEYNIHFHEWSEEASAGGRGHWYGCKDTACDKVGIALAHSDEDGDQKCDVCDAQKNSEWCEGHTPNGEYKRSQGIDYHYPVCSVCGEGYGLGEAHTDDDSDGKCDDCRVIIDSGSACAHDGHRWYTTDTEIHILNCDECDRQLTGAESHTDADSDGRCDVCEVGVGTDLKHTHIGDDWYGYDEDGHWRNCIDDNCSMSADYGEHSDADSDGTCDECGFNPNGPCPHNFKWYSVAESWHRQNCGYCGEELTDRITHTDADANGKCDGCGAGVNGNIIHIHTKATEISTDSQGHWYECTDDVCTSGLDYVAHTDEDGDDRCDTCSERRSPEWCPGHTPTGNYDWVFGSEVHYPVCENCGDRYGKGEAHVADTDYWYSSGDVDGHYRCCEICGAMVQSTLEAHIPNGEYAHGGEEGHYEVCGICQDRILGTLAPHVAGDDWRSMWDSRYHYAICKYCSFDVPAIYENHTDSDSDGVCDKCWSEVDENNIHHHKITEEFTVEASVHYKYCTDGGCVEEYIPHTDNNSDGRCDGCLAKVELREYEGTQEYMHDHTPGAERYKDDADWHYGICTDCGTICEWDYHNDTDDDGLCDACGYNGFEFLEGDISENEEIVAEEIDAAVTSANGTAISKLLAEGKITSDEAEILEDARVNNHEVEVGLYGSWLDDIKEDDSDYATEIAKIKAAITGEYYIGQIIDIMLYRTISVNGELCSEVSVSELPEKLVLGVKMPNVPEMPAGKTYKWKVYRYHDGRVDILDFDRIEDGVGTFSSDKFSVYTLVYSEVKTTPAPVVETVPMHRLFNPNSGEHFYTGSVVERDNLVAAGWNYEGVAWNAPVSGGTPIHRLFNPNNSDHHYTASQEEIDMLVSVGWIYEAVAWNDLGPVADAVPMYRLYNPNADCGSHHYTGSTEERDWLVSLGWHFEGIGWYGSLR